MYDIGSVLRDKYYKMLILRIFSVMSKFETPNIVFTVDV